jgi:hypothetical protein
MFRELSNQPRTRIIRTEPVRKCVAVRSRSWSRPKLSPPLAVRAVVLDVHDVHDVVVFVVVLDVVLGSMRMRMAPRRLLLRGADFCWGLHVPTRTRRSVDRIQCSIDFVCGADAVVLVMLAVVAAKTAGPLLSPHGCVLSWWRKVQLVEEGKNQKNKSTRQYDSVHV